MMKKLVVAVSGGLDSMVLLDILKKHADHELVVAHVDHGIREDSHVDARLVRDTADTYGLVHESTCFQLGKECSEEKARDYRYRWLDGIKQRHGAEGIVTAHHQDDLLETAILNLIRGTGWRGIASLRNTDARLRPLLNVPKVELVRYAIENGITWREDTTNDDMRYLRNRIRQGIMPRLSRDQKSIFIDIIKKQHEVRSELENELEKIVEKVVLPEGINRYQLTMMPDETAFEVLRHATHGKLEPDQLRRLLWFAKTARAGSEHTAGYNVTARATKKHLIV